jgi:serine/threonine protein kinase
MDDNEKTDVLAEQQSEDHMWVTGGDGAITHKRLIDEGAFGEVHHVTPVAGFAETLVVGRQRDQSKGLFGLANHTKSFARKVIQVRGVAMRALVERETQILLELHKAGEHRNIIKILGHGWLPKPYSFYYIDMDLCDSNLHDYIYGARLAETERLLEENPSPVYAPRECDLLIKLRNIWAIMTHISDGLEFIHANGHVHRDLKPRNGILAFGL